MAAPIAPPGGAAGGDDPAGFADAAFGVGRGDTGFSGGLILPF
jgi:hypothetical protein